MSNSNIVNSCANSLERIISNEGIDAELLLKCVELCETIFYKNHNTSKYLCTLIKITNNVNASTKTLSDCAHAFGKIAEANPGNKNIANKCLECLVKLIEDYNIYSEDVNESKTLLKYAQAFEKLSKANPGNKNIANKCLECLVKLNENYNSFIEELIESQTLSQYARTFGTLTEANPGDENIANKCLEYLVKLTDNNKINSEILSECAQAFGKLAKANPSYNKECLEYLKKIGSHNKSDEKTLLHCENCCEEILKSISFSFVSHEEPADLKKAPEVSITTNSETAEYTPNSKKHKTTIEETYEEYCKRPCFSSIYFPILDLPESSNEPSGNPNTSKHELDDFSSVAKKQILIGENGKQKEKTLARGNNGMER